MTWLGAAMWVACAATAAGSGKEPFHVVRDGETVTALARHYYGSSWKAVYIVARNQLESGQKLAGGTRLAIPTSWTHTVRRGDTLAKLAKKYLGPAERYAVLGQENGLKEGQELTVGQELLMPFHLNYVARKGDTYSDLAKRFYRSTRKATLLRDYNGGKPALDEGDKVIIPIFDRSTLEARSRPPPPPPGAEPASERDDGEPADADTPPAVAAPPAAHFDAAALREAVRAYDEGEFAAAQERLEDLLENDPPAEARPTLLRYLGFCAVARGDRSDAEDYFEEWLALEPKATLDPVLTSPKILEVFRAVSEQARPAVAGGG